MENLITFNTNDDNSNYTNLKMLIFSKTSGYKNYIDVSKTFKKVKAVLITPWLIEKNTNYIMTYVQTTDDLKIIYRSCYFSEEGTLIVNNNNGLPDDEGFYGSCIILVLGY